jgi:uncharacterized repeat protein (TIGR03803 family)
MGLSSGGKLTAIRPEVPMFRISTISGKSVSGLALAIFVSLGSAQAGSFQTIDTFEGLGSGDGGNPVASLIADSAGNLYGTTTWGGATCRYNRKIGCGTVFKLAPPSLRGGKWTKTILHAFQGGKHDGNFPDAALTADSAGNLYGTTSFGGRYSLGTVFRLAADGSEKLLYSFCTNGNSNDCADGAVPMSGVIADQTGNLYGTTTFGGNENFCGDSSPPGCGVVFKIAPNGTETVLYAFCPSVKCADGGAPEGGLIADAEGNLYGTTSFGGTSTSCYPGCGTVFKLAPDGTETVLYSFAGGNGGETPLAGLVADKQGNLYGTTSRGGDTGCGGGFGCGIVFSVAPDGSERVLHAFTGGNDGESPRDSLIVDNLGNLYGTTVQGGQNSVGVVFMIAPGGQVTVLHNFSGGSGGAYPYAGLLFKNGHFFGTTPAFGHHHYGTVFELHK